MNSLLSSYQEQEKQYFGKHFLEAEKHDHSFFRTHVKEKYNIIKNIPRDFCSCPDPEAHLILVTLGFASVQSHRYLLLLIDNVYHWIIEKLLERALWRSFSPSSCLIPWVSPTLAPISCGLSGQLLKISQGGDCTTSLSNLFQGCTLSLICVFPTVQPEPPNYSSWLLLLVMLSATKW